MSHAMIVLTLAAGLAVPPATGPQAPERSIPVLDAPQVPPPGEPAQAPPPAEAPKAVPAGTPRAAKAPPGPPKPEPGQLVNVKVDVTISDQRGSQSPITKTVSLTVADRGTGQIRSEGKVRVQKEGTYPVRLAVDLIRPIIEGNKVHMSLAVSYDTLEPATPDLAALEPRANLAGQSGFSTDVRHSLTLVLESGKAVTVAESADPAADRRVTLQVKATILR